MSRVELAIIGTGEVPAGRYPDRHPLEIASRVTKLAIEDAGIKKDDIDAVLPALAIMDNDFNTDLLFGRLPEAFGLLKSCKVTAVTCSGGSSSHTLLKTAQGLLATGEVNMVLVVQAQRFSNFTPAEQADFFARGGSDPEWALPYGISYNALAAMMTQRYMYETGTTIEEVASVCVSHRKWAALQENAMFKKDLTLEEVVHSKMVTTPLTAFMCNVLADGGCAFLVTTAERARKLVNKPVYILGEGSDFSHHNLTVCKDLTMQTFLKRVAERAYETSGLGPEDMDIAELYGAYPSNCLMFLEAMGFCKRGEAGRFVLEGNTWPGGKLPMSTNGEALSFGHTGTGVGLGVFVESVRQLQGKAKRAQVPGARFLIEDCAGGAAMDFHCTVLGNEIP